MVRRDKFVAVSFLAAAELRGCGAALSHVCPLHNDTNFDDLLAAIDAADKEALAEGALTYEAKSEFRRLRD